MKKIQKELILPFLLLLVTAIMVYYYNNYPHILISLSIVCFSISSLAKSADAFIDVSLDIGKRLKISQLGTGTLIVAIGTSAPELFSSLGAAIKDQPGMVTGNVYGTVVANTLLAIGGAAVIAKKSLNIHPRIIATQLPVFFGAITLSFAAFYNGIIDRLEGCFFLVILAFYLIHVYRSSVKDFLTESKDDSPNNDCGIVILFILFLFLLTILFLSGDYAVIGLLHLAHDLNISSEKLATSVLAVGTSIPEIFTAISLVKRNNVDGLFGEVIGSNIFDILAIFGVVSLIAPIEMKGSLITFLIASVSAMFFLTSIMSRDSKIDRVEGMLMLAMFAEFIYILKDI